MKISENLNFLPAISRTVVGICPRRSVDVELAAGERPEETY